MMVTNKGTLLAFCEGRKDNIRDHGDIDLLLSMRNALGKSRRAFSISKDGGAIAR